jgi:hypothetical protein
MAQLLRLKEGEFNSYSTDVRGPNNSGVYDLVNTVAGKQYPGKYIYKGYNAKTKESTFQRLL